MGQKLSGIKVCIWDFDVTLYRAAPAFHREVLEAAYRVIMEHRGWDKEKTIQEFHNLYKVTTPSSTETAAKLAHIPVAQAAIEVEWYKDRTQYISRDEKMIALFSSLRRYRHYILTNSVLDTIIPALKILGIPQKTFTAIVTSEVVGVAKPQPDGFQYIMQKTGLPAAAHLMIGDREAVDLAPAKSLGMRTCLVHWGETKPQTDCVDIVAADVYTVAYLLV